MSTTSQEVVARIASLVSDIVVDAWPRGEKSIFQSHLSAEYTNVINVRFGADAGAVAISKADKGLVSLTVSSAKDILASLIPRIPELTSQAVVLHIAVDEDLSDALSLRTSLPFVLYSSTVQQAHDHALLASRLAGLQSKAVLHIFHSNQITDILSEVDPEKVRSFPTSEPRTPSALNSTNGLNGHTNGVNGHTNGYTNAHGNVSPISSKSGLVEEDSPLLEAYESAALDTLALVRRAILPLTYTGPVHPSTVIVRLGQAAISRQDVGVIQVSLLSPFPVSKFQGRVPTSVSRILVLEQIRDWPAKYTPLFLDVATTVRQRSQRTVIQSGTLGPYAPDARPSSIDIQKLLQKPAAEHVHLGPAFSSKSMVEPPIEIPAHESSSYIKVLNTVFGERLTIENAPDHIPVYGDVAVRPEFALGRIQADFDKREELVRAVRDALRPDQPVRPSEELGTLLSKWLLAKDDTATSRSLAEQIVPRLVDSDLHRLRELGKHFTASSRWIVGSDTWSQDLGASGLHHLIASGSNVNLLLLDTIPYTLRDSSPQARLKKDAGLYAMNHGDVYVASVAIYSSYGQLLQALVEADKFTGPSVVLAYLPYEFPSETEVGALQVLKETKLAVDAGYWPLYRWDPSKEREGKEPFSLDSEAIKADLEEFLDRQNHLSQLVRSTPNVASDLVGGLGESLKEVCCNLDVRTNHVQYSFEGTQEKGSAGLR